ncbi:MAG: choice-of-anchor J domain-containing protein [Proteobacteria bacterium]|nr:choice-of-anchor J domain-containing protein [Pseudomonadota bacterium]
MRVGLLLALLVACNGNGTEDSDSPAPVDVEGPTLTHEAPSGVFVAGDAVSLAVTADDPDGVLSVQASWRPIGVAAWESAVLEDQEGVYTLDVASAPAPGIEYFFRATDGSEFVAVSFLPTDGDDGPFELEVLTEGATVPWTEDFEEGTDALTLYDLEWAEYSYGFPGYAWELTEGRARDQFAVQHRRGLEETGAMDDWLVSPPLDFGDATTAQLSWWEHGTFAGGAQHSLWASTGSADPESGDFVEIAALPAPQEGDWSRAAAVSLETLVGEPLVYLAFRYEGTFADIWTVDDLAVGPVTSDLRIVDVDWTRFDPGATDSMTVTVTNVGPVDAANVVVSGTVDVVDGTVSAPVTVGVLAAGASAPAVLDLSVDATFPDNSWLPIRLDAVADDFSESLDTQVLVGDATVATIGFSTFAEGLVVATVGTGDPDTPDVEVEAATQVFAAGSHELTVDLTAHAALLPPAPGPGRWWVRMLSASAGTTDLFRIDSGTDAWVSDDLGAWPASTETLFWLPRPPLPEVFSSVTVPSPVLPGDNATWTLTLVNHGPPTVGVTTADVSSADTDITLFTPGPFALGSDWAENATASLPLSFLALPSQNDSQPVRFEVAVTDELESFLVLVDVPVPWPLLDLTAVVVEDGASGNGDGLPDAGESFELSLDLTNSGALDTFGPVYCTLSQTGGAATATITDANALFSTIEAGQTQSDQGPALSVAGTAGDDVDLLLTCTDDDTTYLLDFELIVGEPPWRALTTTHDTVGDASDYAFDFVSAQWRVVGDVLEIRMVSAVPYEASTLFLEAFMDSTGSPFFDYNVIIQSGVTRLRGRDITGYQDLPGAGLIEIDAQTVLIQLPIPEMQLVQNVVTIGWGTGYCGSASYYCDHFPDGWGAPYQGMDMTLWATMAW